MGSIHPAFVYFDLDDTLLHHKQAERNALRDIYNDYDFFKSVSADQLIQVYHDVNSDQWLKYSRGEVTREQLQRNRFKFTLQKLAVADDQSEEVGMQYLNRYQKHWEWLPGAQQVFQQISSNYSVGILTNGFAETQKKKFEQFDLYKWADQLVISEEVGHLKPHPAVFARATDLAKCDADEILYVGDSYTSDVLGGTEFGWQVAWFTQNGEAEKRKKANFVFNDFNDLIDLLKL